MQTRKIVIRKTNRRIKESKYLIACKEYDGVLGNYEMYHQTDIDDILEENFYVDAGSNLKRLNQDYSDWQGLADRIAKPGVIARLGKLLRP